MISIPFIYFTLLAIHLIRKKGGIDICSYIVMVYALSAFCAILIDFFGIYSVHGVCEEQPISLLATLCYCALLTLAILPFSTIRNREIKKIDIQKEWLVDALSWVLIFTFFITFFSIFSNIEQVLQSDLKEVRDDLYKTTDSVKLTGIQYLLTIPDTLFSQFSPIAILFYYINVTQKRKTTLFNWFLLLASLTPVIKAILIAGRTQPIYWLLSFLAIHFFYRPMLDKEQRRKVLLPFMVFGSVVVLFIASVTVARFTITGTQDIRTLNSIIAYTGQSFINFNNFFCNYTFQTIHLDRILPLTNHFIIHPEWNLNEYRDIIWSDSGMDIGVFYTFLGDLMVDLGFVGMCIYILLFTGISTCVCMSANKNGVITLSRLLVILILLLIPLHGVFYYSYYKVNVGYFVVGTLLYSWMLSHTFKKGWKE